MKETRKVTDRIDRKYFKWRGFRKLKEELPHIDLTEDSVILQCPD